MWTWNGKCDTGRVYCKSGQEETFWSADSDGRLKRGEKEGTNSKSNGGKQSKRKRQNRNKASKARRKRKTQASQRRWVERQRYGQAEEVQASSEGEMRGAGRTRPAGKAKGKVTEEKANMKAKEEDLAA